MLFTDDRQEQEVRDPGDSGGPWVGWRNGGWRLLAVVYGYAGDNVNLQEGTSPMDRVVDQKRDRLFDRSYDRV